MHGFRYWLAVLVVVTAPGALLFWFSVHPFIHFWRRVGLRRTLALHYAMIAAVAAVVFTQRDRLLAIDYGTSWPLVAAGISLLVVSAYSRVAIQRQLSTQVLTGLPELEPQRDDSRLLTEGIYAHIRHPRYLQLLLALAGYALITNYRTVYLLLAVSVVAVLIIVRLEEKELVERFGDDYLRYCREVPRFLPWRRRSR